MVEVGASVVMAPVAVLPLLLAVVVAVVVTLVPVVVLVMVTIDTTGSGMGLNVKPYEAPAVLVTSAAISSSSAVVLADWIAPTTSAPEVPPTAGSSDTRRIS